MGELKELFEELIRIMEEMLQVLSRDDMERFWELDGRRKEIFNEIKGKSVDTPTPELGKKVEEARALTDRLFKLAEEKKGEVGREMERIREFKMFLSAYRPSTPKHPRFLDIKE